MRWRWSRRDREADLDRELSDHLDLESEARERDALSSANARREARVAFGNPAVIREDVREAWGGMWLERLVVDVRYAVRMWARTPGFTLTAVATLSLAIGATTAIFGQINAVFWKPVPVSRPDGLRFLAWTSARPRFVLGPNVLPGPQIGNFQTFGSFSHPAYIAMRDGTRAFSDLACWSDLGEARPIILGELGFGAVQFVSGNYFQTLGVGASVGRTIQPDDDRPSAWSPVAMISYPFWNRTFALDPSVTRQTLRLNGRTFAIVGVMPQGFFGTRQRRQTSSSPCMRWRLPRRHRTRWQTLGFGTSVARSGGSRQEHQSRRPGKKSNSWSSSPSVSGRQRKPTTRHACCWPMRVAASRRCAKGAPGRSSCCLVL